MAQILNNQNIHTIEDLLLHFPRRYEDRRRSTPLREAGEEPVCAKVRVKSTRLKWTARGGWFEVTVEEINLFSYQSTAVLRWFHMPFLQKVLAAGQILSIYGKARWMRDSLVFHHPDFEILEEISAQPATAAASSLHFDAVVPIYPLQGMMAQKPHRELMHRLWQNLTPADLPDRLREPARASRFGGWSRWRALQTLHFPQELAEVQVARHYLALEKMTAVQLQVLQRQAVRHEKTGINHAGEGKLLRRFLETLPFQLTAAQRRCIADIRADLRVEKPMHRLLQGDVGSGKTLVALCAMLLVVEKGFQAVLMAPTQILAEQHFLTCRQWLEPMGIHCGLRTAGRREDISRALSLSPEEKAPQILVGTHALLFNEEDFTRLGLVVIDEQHKFGVQQRDKLAAKGEEPDVLVMTATPIPRTLMLTHYGDLEVSLLDERPAGRGKIITEVRATLKMKALADFLKLHLQAGRQVYLVHPLVEESEQLLVTAAVAELEPWQKRLAPHAVELLHGRMKPEEKDAVMTRFRDGMVSALVTTSVIEVGVDVPNATVMVIFDADRFGMAQLHQLRGRVGRSSLDSHCLLYATTKADEENLAKLQVLAGSDDGFHIADADLRRRGPGDVFGCAQSGFPDVLFPQEWLDLKLLSTARRLAREILESDPNLQKLENQHFWVAEERKSLIN